MAVAGGATSAYRCRVMDCALYVESTTRLRSECAPVQDALARLGRGEVVVVAGSDLAALRKILKCAVWPLLYGRDTGMKIPGAFGWDNP